MTSAKKAFDRYLAERPPGLCRPGITGTGPAVRTMDSPVKPAACRCSPTRRVRTSAEGLRVLVRPQGCRIGRNGGSLQHPDAQSNDRIPGSGHGNAISSSPAAAISTALPNRILTSGSPPGQLKSHRNCSIHSEKPPPRPEPFSPSRPPLSSSDTARLCPGGCVIPSFR